MFKELTQEKKLFIGFLVAHFLVWSLICAIRMVLPTDTLEGIWWGSLFSLGNPKHSPLAGWLTYFTYNTFFQWDMILYFMSQAFIIAGFIYVYKLAKCFLNESQAMLSVIVLEGCWIYSYITGYYGFNPDVVLLCMLPAITYYFYKCMNTNRLYYWVMLGVFVGISFLDKYQTGMLIAAMALWALIFNRKVFISKYFYLAVSIAFVIFLPHLLWLIKYDFLPFLYYSEKLRTISIYRYIIEPVSFFIMQLSLIAGAVVIFMVNKIRQKSEFSIRKEIDKNGWFLIILTAVPIIILLIMTVSTGSNVRPQWGYLFWYMIGIMLFYFIPTETDTKDFKTILKCSCIVMLLIFLSFGTMLVVEKSYRSRYPAVQVCEDFKQIWESRYKTPFKYIGGLIDFTYPITIYGESHPINIMDTYGYENIWIDENDLKKHGALIISKRSKELRKYVKSACPYLPDDIEVKPEKYRFKLVNSLGLSREYKMYYFIVPPEKDSKALVH